MSIAVLLIVMFQLGAVGVVGLCVTPNQDRFKRRQSAREFEEPFPEALDLLPRAIRAGHALKTALGMVVEEMKDPSGPEFKMTFDRQNFGSSPMGPTAIEFINLLFPMVDNIKSIEKLPTRVGESITRWLNCRQDTNRTHP